MTEFKLSDKRKRLMEELGAMEPSVDWTSVFLSIEIQDKEFIRRLKEEVVKGCMGTSVICTEINKEIDKLAGDLK